MSAMSQVLQALAPLLLAIPPADRVPAVTGDYVEARTCDVWTGPCFANGEMNLTGDRAILAWSVREGSVGGVPLAGLAVAAVVDAEGTLGTKAEGRIRAAVFVDDRATSDQAAALLRVATRLAPTYLANVVRVERRRITYERKGGVTSVEVENGAVRLEAKPLSLHCDRICGNEEQAYPPLARVEQVECMKAVENRYRGVELGGTHWSVPNRRSGMVGRFSL